MTIAAVIIGRNEGARLLVCLDAIPDRVSPVIYVDSGSTDQSVESATARGAVVVQLDATRPFTAARARNTGLDRLQAEPTPPDYVQFIDGDCALRDGWLDAAETFLETHLDVAVVCGRRRERFPDASPYNALTDAEWDTPVGETRACGGDALMRWASVMAVGGYNSSLIAGEEPELCIRLRHAGWRIWRLDQEMTWHDVDMTRFSQWWQRSKRAGHAFAEGATLHGSCPERHNIAPMRRALLWGAVLPLVLIGGFILTPWALLLALLWPIKVLRLWLRGTPLQRAFFLTIGNFPESLGILGYWARRLIGRRSKLIEYK